MSDSTEKKTCAGCGLLCAVDRQTQGEVMVDAALRKHWKPVSPEHFPEGKYEHFPRCHVSAFPLEMECDQEHLAAGRFDTAEKVNRVISKDRQDCLAFTPWVAGRSPGWHQDQAMFAEIQKRDEERREADRNARKEDREDERNWQVAQKAEEHTWQADQKNTDRQWQVDQRESERAWQVKQKWWDRFFAIVLAVVGFFLGSLFSRDKPSEIRPEIKQEKEMDGGERSKKSDKETPSQLRPKTSLGEAKEKP
jgi:hypothetical protein